MRITGGTARGISLILPTRGEIRPATDYLREAVFSSLGELVVGASVLDCFAGTGAYSWEALSRGAISATLADKNPAAISAQKKNFSAVEKSLESCGKAVPVAKFLLADIFSARPFPQDFSEKFDLVFCDPPWVLWEKSDAPAMATRVASFARAKSPGARVIFETPASFEPPVPAGWQVIRHIGKKGKDQPAATILAPSFDTEK